MLRKALGREDYRLEYGENGKPYLTDGEGVHFNLSHSGRWVVIAYGATPVGVDVQELRANGLEVIARRFFTADERTYAQRDAESFFRIWTGKESYIKYLGAGLKTPLNSFSVLEDLGVNLFTERLDNACLTLCTQEDSYTFTRLEKL
jgi:4'-phosphopantetheinyl transferase